MCEEWRKYMLLVKERPEIFVNNGGLKIIKDSQSVEAFATESGRKMGVVYSSPYHMMVVDLVEDKQGHRFAYERIVPTVAKGAVVAIPIYQGQFVLLNQYRHALRGVQYAFPRGFGERELSTEENLKKEIMEEIGAIVHSFKHVGQVVADSGICGNAVDVYSCEISKPKQKPGYEGIKNMVLLSETELQDWIARGGITDGFTLSAYALYKCNKGLFGFDCI